MSSQDLAARSPALLGGGVYDPRPPTGCGPELRIWEEKPALVVEGIC